MLTDICVHLEDTVGSLGLCGGVRMRIIALSFLDLGHLEWNDLLAIAIHRRIHSKQEVLMVVKEQEVSQVPAGASQTVGNFFSCCDKIIGPRAYFSTTARLHLALSPATSTLRASSLLSVPHHGVWTEGFSQPAGA